MRGGSASRAPPWYGTLAWMHARRLRPSRSPLGAQRAPRPPAFDAWRLITPSAHASVVPTPGSVAIAVICPQAHLLQILQIEISIVSRLLHSARRHVRQAFSMPVHRIGVPRGNAPGRECRGRGRPLPPPAQGNLHLSKGRNQGRPRECAPRRRAASKAAPSCYNSAPTRSARRSLCLSCRWQRVESQPAA